MPDDPERRGGNGQSPWFAAGLRFECTRCGGCCRGRGNVHLSDDEASVLAKRFGLSLADFLLERTHRLRGGGLLLRSKRNSDCTFYERDRGCTVYEDRPRQCRTFPFWRGNLDTAKSWDAAAASCPGIGAGPLHPAPEIARIAVRDGLPSGRLEVRDGLLPSGRLEVREVLPSGRLD